MRIILKCVVVIVACLLLGASLLADSSGDTNQACLTSFFTKMAREVTPENFEQTKKEQGSIK